MPVDYVEIDGLKLEAAQKRIAELEAALREIAGTYDETPQTATKLCAALYAVSKLCGACLARTADAAT